MRAYPPFFRYDLISASISQFALLCKQKYGAAACLFGCPACPSGRKQKKPDGRGRMRAEQAPLYTLVPTWFGARKRATNRKSFFVCFRSGCPQRRFGEEIRLKTVQVSPGVRSGNREASDKSHVSFFAAAHPEDRSLPPGRSSQALTPFCPGQTQNVAYPGGFVSEMTQGGEQSALGARGRRRSLHESKSEIGMGLARD